MPLSEADTRAKLIDPAIRASGWPENLIRREENAGAVVHWGGRGGRSPRRIDYVLRAPGPGGAPIPVALIEAKPERERPLAGLEQAKEYGRLHRVPFVYASNGRMFAEHCLDDGATRGPLPLAEFPAPGELLARYRALRGLDLDAPGAAPLLQPPDGEDRYYQRAAVRAVLERLARGERRALLSLATGSGKTRIAVRLLRALADAGQLRRALFVCDRDELRSQALTALHGAFGDDAAAATARDPARNARVVVATYQTLGVGEDDEGGEDSRLARHYPRNWFSHVVIDECHRSAWGKWSAVLTRNDEAVHIGLTATPRRITPRPGAGDADRAGDDAITRNNYEYFGEPAYEYGIAQGMDDGYLAAMRVERSDVLTAGQLEREQGVERDRLEGGDVRDAITGLPAAAAEMRGRYAAGSLEQDLMIAERTEALCGDLFARLAASEDGPEQKTLVFCASDDHADRVAAALNDRYAAWARAGGRAPADPYAFKCTAAGGSGLLATLKANQRRAFVACTVDLISTGVDVPCLRHVVFLRYLKSPIAFHQMLGRGTRIHEPTGKLAFTVHDYTDATRLLDAPLAQRAEVDREPPGEPGEEREPVRRFDVRGIEVRVLPGGTAVAVQEGGRLRLVPLAEYRERLAERLLAEVPALGGFRERWIDPPSREALLAALPDEGRSAEAYRAAAGLEDCDLYDVLASAGWDETPRPRVDRAGRVREADPEPPAIERALARQFALGGTEALESERLREVAAVSEAGGLAALAAIGDGAMPALKRRLLATDAEWTPQ